MRCLRRRRRLRVRRWRSRRKHGTIVSYDLNYRESLWKSIGGQAKAVAVNRELAPLVDVMIGNEEDFTAALGFEVEGQDEHHSKLDVRNFQRMIERAVAEFPNFKVVATTLRNAKTATINDWGAVCYTSTANFIRRRFARISRFSIESVAAIRLPQD